jgi:serine/threonine-protein kinase HipA
MITSDAPPSTAFVWTWLPGTREPVPAGRLDLDRTTVVFTYGRSYLNRTDAVPLYLPELPLVSGTQLPLFGDVAGCVRDAAPDGWGQRVIENRFASKTANMGDLGLLTYLLESGSNRIGALDFQVSPRDYIARHATTGTVAELMESADRVEAGIPLSPELDRALMHGTSIGGARPKATLTDDGRELIAKFSSRTDTTPLVKFEYLGMELARRCGINAAAVELAEAAGRTVLFVERFDRPGNGMRRAMVSALTVLGLDEPGGRYASYATLADHIRARFTDSDDTLRELFARITFNILLGNTDDHARNHAAFWDGSALTLTPAYDIAPWLRSGGETAQSMILDRLGNRDSRVARCVEAANEYHLSVDEARTMIDGQIASIESNWSDVCDAAGLTAVDRQRLRNGAVLHPSALYGY